ncbi:hypothetical protein AABM38_11800 [Heyndrickxia sp. MSNUG]|uniref:hypothetical protein n=1 Tax=Heyndrickxia sp. MSNUG TaxID=3136677 RepID=UPI003C307E6A
MNLEQIFKAGVAGIISGVILGLILKLVEYMTNLKVYTLLLNVDYFPVLKKFEIPEAGEFGIHLFISIILAILVQNYMRKKAWGTKRTKHFTVILSIAVGVLLYPTTMLSERTPEITSTYAFLFWICAHALYGWVLATMLKKTT